MEVTFCSMDPDEDDPLDDEPADIPEPLRPDPAWDDELDLLLEIVRRGSAKELAVLARLTNLVLQQQRHLQELAPEKKPQIEVRNEFDDATGEE